MYSDALISHRFALHRKWQSAYRFCSLVTQACKVFVRVVIIHDKQHRNHRIPSPAALSSDRIRMGNCLALNLSVCCEQLRSNRTITTSTLIFYKLCRKSASKSHRSCTFYPMNNLLFAYKMFALNIRYFKSCQIFACCLLCIVTDFIEKYYNIITTAFYLLSREKRNLLYLFRIWIFVSSKIELP